MNKLTGLIIIGLLIVGGVFLFNQKKPVIKQESTTIQQPLLLQQRRPVKEFIVTAKQLGFNPAIITVKQGR